ncbi:prenyltransferase/squalene oxidase repeat-containing protein [Aquimarina algiphila]|uniref:prenyltransferase/squalene oxidase repeat-containing protein n=1 Tax=Aquimarina algiphila TaxID=2047982 RepID=UPI0024937C59|nr:prenyltransferase/squalene oxidase repeat-containing protein [Aquimarina algiphila]
MSLKIAKENIDELVDRSIRHLMEEYREISDSYGWHQYLGSEKIGNIANAQALLIFRYFDRQFDNKVKVLETLRNNQLKDKNDIKIDGGWTYRTNYTSAPTTECTCWTLSALTRELDSNDEVINKGINWLLNNHPNSDKDLGWGSVKEDIPRTYATCLALRILKRYGRQNTEEFKRALSWLKNAKNKDGGWGDNEKNESTITHTAHSVITLISCGYKKDSSIVDDACSWLLAQYEDHENWIDIQNGGLLELLDFEGKRISYYHYSVPWVLVALLKCDRLNTSQFFTSFKELIDSEDGGNWIHPFLMNQKYHTIWSKHDCLLAIYNLKKGCPDWDSLKSIKLKGDNVVYDCKDDSGFFNWVKNKFFFNLRGNSNQKPKSEERKISWWIIAVVIGIIAIIIKVILDYKPNWIDKVLIGICVTVLVLYFNPKRRYFKASLSIISILGAFKLFSMEKISANISGKFEGSIFSGVISFISEEPDPLLYIVLGILAAVCLILDFKERSV